MPTPADIHSIIGSMLMVGIRGPGPEDAAFRADLDACREACVGGVILFDVHLPDRTRDRNIISPGQIRELCDHLRRELGDRLLISVDQEGGSVARLSPTRGFQPQPSAAEVAAFPYWKRHFAPDRNARQVAAAGCNLNFAPCVDVAINPDNPIIAGKQRSFGVDPQVIVNCAERVIHAHTQAGVATCLKHFPGHGSSAGDTHEGFVDITHSWQRSVELQPFRWQIPTLDPRWTCIMTAHVFHSGIDPDHPASLSRRHTTDLLRDELGFRGVVITDSLDMGAITQRYPAHEALILAINAGADILLDGCNAPGMERPCPAREMHEAITRALRDGRIIGGEERLRASAARIARLLAR